MMGWGGHGYGMWGGGFGGFIMILFWILIIVGVVLVARYFVTGPSAAGRRVPGPDPVEILRERYARGEIDTEEFEERMKKLESGS